MIIKFGDSGELVRILQEILGIEADGIFGSKTIRSVKNYQQRNGLTIDGIVGPMTWKKLGYDPLELTIDTDREQYENWLYGYFKEWCNDLPKDYLLPKIFHLLNGYKFFELYLCLVPCYHLSR